MSLDRVREERPAVVLRDHRRPTAQQARRQELHDDHAGQSAEQQVAPERVGERRRDSGPHAGLPRPVLAQRAVGDRTALGPPGAAAGEGQGGHVVRTRPDGEGAAVIGAGQQTPPKDRPREAAPQVSRSAGRPAGVDPRPEHVGELPGRVAGPDAHDAAAQRMRGHVRGERLWRHGGADGDAPAGPEPGIGQRAGQPPDHLQQLTP